MSKKQVRVKRAEQTEAAPQPRQLKSLVLTPQIAVGIRGTYPEQEIFVEEPAGGGYRKQTVLTPDNAFRIIEQLLMEKAGEIELERQLREAARSHKRRSRQPDWITIAEHPEATIREGLIAAHLCAKGSITVLPTRARELLADKATQTLEEMGL